VNGRDVLLWTGILVAAIFAVRIGSRLVWWILGQYKLRTARHRPLRALTHVLWRDPGPIERRDPVAGPGGRELMPQPPYRFVEEHGTGSQPCVSVRDARGHVWRAKWGAEVRSETFAVRFAWACGYFAEVTHFVAEGVIEGAEGLQRAGAHIDDAGAFREARFELDDPNVRKLFEEHSWAWNDNPFVGTRELTGLKAVVMLLSNWDTKDRRDVARGSNTAVFEHTLPGGQREARYLITDWGGSMGTWGTSQLVRGRWDPDGFAAQSDGFVTGVADGCVSFAYAGQRTADIAAGVRLDHLQWLMPWLDRLTDSYLRAALTASGASDDEATIFAEALRRRIDQMRAAVAGAEAPVPAEARP
jgi:hypothetical protein